MEKSKPTRKWKIMLIITIGLVVLLALSIWYARPYRIARWKSMLWPETFVSTESMGKTALLFYRQL
ncbi:MAG: hypothetical protein FWE69_00355 [Clostridiales bacterium]|nr:hypothetical protein [Clostridiales bacterium]